MTTTARPLYVGTCTCRRWQGRRLASWSAAQWAAARHIARTHGTSTRHYGEVVEVER